MPWQSIFPFELAQILLLEEVKASLYIKVGTFLFGRLVVAQHFGVSLSHIYVYTMGGNDQSTTSDRYFKFDITYSAPMEMPEGPCYAWNGNSGTYDHICGPIDGGGPGGI